MDNSSIVVEYHGHEYPVLFAHSNGKSLNISYADSGLISYIDLLDEENIIEKTRSVTCVCALHMNALKNFFNLSNILTIEKARQSVPKRQAKSVKLKFSNPLLPTVLINTAAPQR